LQLRNVRETDRVVTFYTDTVGKLVLVARHALRSHRRFGGALDSFAHLRLLYRQEKSAMAYLVEVEPLALHLALRDHLDRIAAASYAAELVLSLTRVGDANPALFELLALFLGYCEEKTLTPPGFLRFHLRLLELLGLRPELDFCGECGQPLHSEKESWLDLHQGAALCSSCRLPATPPHIPRVREPIRQLLLDLQQRQSPPASEQDYREAIWLLDQLMVHLLRRPPKSRSFLREMAGF
jgi:DNA repair protein RecO